LGEITFHEGGHIDACWDLLISIDPGERLKQRVQQKIYLARYARQDVFAWETRETSELDAYFEATSEMIKGENSASNVEDR
jgi:hypothetical protein